MNIGAFETGYDSKTVSELVSLIDIGELTLPSWQRDYVWREPQIIDLIDTMLDRASIGTATIWETMTRLNKSFKFLNQDLPDYDIRARVKYAIDGQQRLSTIYGLYKGITFQDIDFKKFKVRVIDVPNEEDTSIVYYDKDDELNSSDYISVTDALRKNLNSEKVSNASNALDIILTLTSYRVNITNSVSDDASKGRKNFLRINRAGKTLSMPELMNAIVYNDESGFYLFEKIDEALRDITFIYTGNKSSSRDKFLRILSSMYRGGVARNHVESLNPETVISNWDKGIEAIKNAVDFVKESFLAKDLKDIGGMNLVYCYAHFFYRNKNRRPNAHQRAGMERIFWYSLITDQFAKGSNSEVLAINSLMNKLVNNEDITLDKNRIPLLENFITKGAFNNLSNLNKFSRAISLYLLNNNPKSYVDGKAVNHNTLSKANKLNKDHVFPYHIYKEKSNNIFNITLLDFQTNRDKGHKKPSEYFYDTYLSEDMLKSHFISEEAITAIKADSLDSFILFRAKSIRDSILEFLN